MENKLMRNKWFLYITEFFAGVSVMAVELGASRLMAPYFSSSQIVWTVIIGVIMIAMAIGNLWGGKLADKTNSPDKLYGRILLAAIWIALIPFAGRWLIAGISLLLATFVMVYSVTRPGALAGVRYFLVPRFEDFSIMTVVAAMGQMFYSLSIAMGILYTYGSYMHKDVDIEKSTEQVEFFDTGVAVLAGLMIIPAVFAFSGGTMENLKAGPSLAFITLPKVFASMEIGGVIGTAFFLMFFFAALTSAISLLETSVSTLQDELHLTRPVCCVLMALLMVVLGSCSAFGYGMWDHVLLFGMQILDFFDFLTNSIMMPIAALATCFLILKVVGFKRIADEVQISSVFHRRKVYEFFMKYLAPVCILVILLSSIANVLGLITM